MYIGLFSLLSPIVVMTVGAVVVLILGVIASKKPHKGLDYWFPSQYAAPVFTLCGLIVAGGLVWWSLGVSGLTQSAEVGGRILSMPMSHLFVTAGGHAQLVFDPFAAVFGFIAFAGLLIVMIISLDHFGEDQLHKAEYYSLLMLATAASALCAAASDLIAIYLSIEFLSLSSYALAAFAKRDRRSAEAGLKYFLYGAACSAVMIYGMSILFGITGGSTALTAVAAGLTPGAAASGAAWAATILVLVGLGFKVALVPFHFWAPDVYEGAPTPVTAFLSVVSKAAGIAVLARFLLVAGIPTAGFTLGWYWILAAFTAASMFFGNLVAIPQRNIKRMLAYSSIAQAGYLMIGVLSASASLRSAGAPGWDLQGVLIYFFAYLFMNLGAFVVVTSAGRRLGSDVIEDYAGLMKRAPFAAAAMTVFLVSLAGVPPTAGFLGKLFIFGGAIEIGLKGHPELIALAVIGVVNSVISAFYYLNVVRLMFFALPKNEAEIPLGGAVLAAAGVCVAVTLGLIVFWKPAVELASQAVYAVASSRGIILH